MISPSILACDFTRIREQFEIMNKSKVDYVHLDVMDGVYVPNISFGPDIIAQLRNITDIPFDVHLMIEQPERYIDDFVKAGADIITIHPSATKHLNRTLNLIKEKGVKAGMAINPAENLNILDYTIKDLDLVLIMSVNPGFGGQKFIEQVYGKIASVRKIIDRENPECILEVDGGVKLENALKVYESGADFLVAGSAIFGAEDPMKAIELFKEIEK
ncbi:MAG: ribulose-phosphate 3-epimerase [Peptoniphilus sp.]|uniref:ribulose-phosphate 3-epimerase n=1 Tax=Peptoniphilus sp. TaxID=1971214 RepID=UPI002A747A4F|nr:ribulose-phosphate 3-epimerase [Peptoniphilus sp.]MDY2986232.1 ribulose-phosphate 3-epimerase [Peptoniphilus sp.]